MLPPQDSRDDHKPRTSLSAVSGMRAGFSSWLLRLAAPRAAALLAFERHRANNQVQVLGGWITLGRLEKAQDYLARVMEAERVRSDTLRTLPPWAQLRLVELWDTAERAGVSLVLEAPAGCRPSWPRLFAVLARLMHQAAAVHETVTVNVRVQGVGFRIQVSGRDAQEMMRAMPGTWDWVQGTAVLHERWQEGADDVR